VTRIDRALAEVVFRDAVAACDPAARVREALAEPALASQLAYARPFGLAIGKAALAMARGAGPVVQGIAIAPGEATTGAGAVFDPSLPPGWRRFDGPHPEIDGRSRGAAELAWQVVGAAERDDVVLALISGGASALVEAPRGAITVDELRSVTRALMAAGAPIGELNTVRSALSLVKAGGLVVIARAKVITLAISDVIGDDLHTIGSGPTVGPWIDAPGQPVDLGAGDRARRSRAAEILGRHGVSPPPSVAAVLAGTHDGLEIVRHDLARVIAPMNAFARAAAAALSARGIDAPRMVAPLGGDVRTAAQRLMEHGSPLVAWGEPTLRIPQAHGEGGRSQQLALELARLLSGTERTALVAGSDGVDGPAPRGRPTPAGAFVDGTTWAAITAAGFDPAAALERCDAGTVLAAVGALVVTGPTGINHADLVILG